MAPMNPEDAKAEQLRLAKELQRDFQKSGTFKGNSSGQGRASSQSSKPSRSGRGPPPHVQRPTQVPRQRVYNQTATQARKPNSGKGVSNSKPVLSSDNRKRKMNTQPEDFFADRPNTSQERGRPVQFYQGQDRATASATNFTPTAPTMAVNSFTQMHTAPSMGLNATRSTSSNMAPGFSLIDTPTPEQQSMQTSQHQPLQPTTVQGRVMGQANAAPVSTPMTLPFQAEIPRGPVVWLYQDNNEQPQPLARDDTMMDTDMPDVSTAGALSERPYSEKSTCTCTRTSAPGGGTRGLGASRWAAGGMKVDHNCPEHGTGTTSFWANNDSNSSATQPASENLPKPLVWYYQ